ncbi:hypothetical protein SO802_022797 [Lithocarpus litseifolius]|uniref:Uncharacterized protein n=1 Tax=Lithocarpus litseifolius TaxID=425828 RepID=A0AAW2C809_9ROSI
MKEEERRRIAAMDAFHIAEKSNKELKNKLQEEEKERKSATTVLHTVEKQAEGQRVLLRNAEDQLAASKEQIVALKKKFKEVMIAKVLAEKEKEEAEKAKEEAEQHGYDVGVVETEEALRAEVPAVCRTYYALVWDEAFNQVGVEPSSMLWKAKSVYYPSAIRPSSSSSSKADLAEGAVKSGDTNKETSQDASLPLVAPKEAPQNVELVLATFLVPPKDDPKGKAQMSTTASTTQPPKNPKDNKLVIKMK